MNCSGDDTSVEAGNTLWGVESSQDLSCVAEHACAGALVLDNDSCYLEGVRQDDATESIAKGDQSVVVAKQCGNQSSGDQKVSTNWRNQTKGKHAGHSNLGSYLAVGFSLAIVEGLLVYLKNI